MKVAKTWMMICLMTNRIPRANSRSVHKSDLSGTRSTNYF